MLVSNPGPSHACQISTQPLLIPPAQVGYILQQPTMLPNVPEIRKSCPWDEQGKPVECWGKFAFRLKLIAEIVSLCLEMVLSPGSGLKTALALERQDFWFLVLNKVLVPFQAFGLMLLEQEQVYFTARSDLVTLERDR